MSGYLRNRAALVTAAFAIWAGTALPARAEHCSRGSVAGSYGYTTEGFVTAPNGVILPAVAVGRITFDGNGTVGGTQTRVVAGSALDETYSGTFTVNSDCTGSFTVNVLPDARTSTVNLVWTENTNSAVAVFTTPGFTLSATARRISLRASN